MSEAACDLVLLSWNQLEETRACLESLFEQTDIPCRLLLVDNGSEPPVREFLRSVQPQGQIREVTVLQNGRVRAGYHVAQLLHAEVLIHLIGERPGTGLNMASAYLTYGRDTAGQPRWDPRLDHSCTTAVCGIHPQGKPPEAAVAEIARTVHRMFEQRRSGVALR